MLKFIAAAAVTVFLFSCRNTNKRGTFIPVPDYNPTPRILICGLPEQDEMKIKNAVANIYGFHFYRIGACVISKELRDSMQVENNKVYKALDIKYGAKWRTRFEKQLYTIYH